MKIVGSGRTTLAVLVDSVVVYAKLFTTGKDVGACNEQASNLADEVIGIYKKSFNNVKFFAVTMDDVRCVDGSGFLSAEHNFSIRLEVAEGELLNSLKKFEELTQGMSDTFRLIGWDTSVSEERVKRVVAKVIDASYKEAIYEAECLVPKTKEGKYDIDEVIVKNWDSGSWGCSVTLPDTSNDDRIYIFDHLEDVTNMYGQVCREVVVSIFC